MLQRTRRWFQFSLATLAITVTVLCIWLGAVKRAKTQEQAVNAIRMFGGSVTYRWELDGRKEPHAPKWLRICLGDDFFQRVCSVAIDEKELMVDAPSWVKLDAVVAKICDIRTVENVAVRNPEFGDDHLTKLASLPHLQSLQLYWASVTDSGVAAFRVAQPSCTVTRR